MGREGVRGASFEQKARKADLGQLLVLREDGFHLFDVVLESKGL